MRRLRVLGPLEVDGAAPALGPRDRVVVSALALSIGNRVEADVLADALWGEAPPASAAKVVQGCVSRLRRVLGADTIETAAGGYRLLPDLVTADAQEFEDLVKRAQEHIALRTPERAIPLLVDALALWRGPALADLEDWLPGRLEAVRLGQLRLVAEEDLLQARLDTGDHAGVATDGTVLAGQQPFRERRWAVLALAQYRAGRQADALASIRSARRALGQELGLDPGSDLVALEARILGQDPALAAEHEARLTDQVCPWKGLAPYGDGDGETFFARDLDVAACVARLEESPLLVVTGPSGSGKSSLVQAGLVPALRRMGRSVEVFTPGTDGGAAMATARHRRATDPVLVVDQFEETFTLGGAAYARPWLGDLARYALGSAPVVIVVRGDHVAGLGTDPELARLAERGLHLVAPLTGEGLREVVEGPARVAGLRLEPGLVDLVLQDADGQPGALPLLSHALTETWQRREGGLLTVEGYRLAGGIRDAVAASAERLYDALSPDERGDLRWLMLRMAALSEGGEASRTPLPASVVEVLDPVRRRLLDVLVRARLVTSRDGGYDLAHEALVRAWPRLQAWLDEDRSGQRIRQHLALAAAGWEALDRADSELYRGARLAAAVEWLDRTREPLVDPERAFLETSTAVADTQVRQLAAESRRQRAQNQRLRALVAATVVLLLAAGAAGLAAVDSSRDAAAGRDDATRSARQAGHDALVARSLALRSTDRSLAALLAVLAWRQDPDRQAESALLSNVTASPGFLGYRSLSIGVSPLAVAAVPDGRLLASSGNAVVLLDPSSERPPATFQREDPARGGPSELEVSADGSRAVQLLNGPFDSRCRTVCWLLAVVDIAHERFLRPAWRAPSGTSDVAISANGRMVAAVAPSGDRWRLVTWDAVTGRALAAGPVGGASVVFGGRWLYVGRPDGLVREVSARTLRTRRTWQLPAGSVERALVVAGGVLTGAGASGQAAVELATGRELWRGVDGPRSATSGCASLAVSVPGRSVLCGTDGGVVTERDLRDGEPTGRQLDSQLGGGGDLTVVTAADGSELLYQGGLRQLSYAVWRLDGSGPGAELMLPDAVAAGFDPTGRRFLATRNGRSEVFEADGRLVRRLPVEGRASWLTPTIIGVAGRRAALVDLVSGRVKPLLSGRVDRVFRGSDDRAWAVTALGSTTVVRGFSPETGRPFGPELPVFEDAADARVVSDEVRVLVTARNAGYAGPAESWRTTELDTATGTPQGRGLANMSQVTIAPDDRILTAGQTGAVAVYSGMFATPDISFPRVRDDASSVQIDARGRLALVTSRDQTLHLFDWPGGERYGDPIGSQAPAGEVEGWLRPDGEQLLVNSGPGVVAWDLRPAAMAEALCRIAGRNPTYGEWETFFGDPEAYDEPVCPGYPTAADQVDQTS